MIGPKWITNVPAGTARSFERAGSPVADSPDRTNAASGDHARSDSMAIGNVGESQLDPGNVLASSARPLNFFESE